MSKKIFIPTENAESWKKLLAEPEKHWKHGYSAMALAEVWEKTEGNLPREIQSAFNKESELMESEFLFALPEFKVILPGGVRPSQNDLLLLTRNVKGLSVVAVEGKAKENFDELIVDWLKDASTGRKERLNFLMETIHLSNVEEIMDVRYQFFHRLASAIIMAQKFHAKNAIMLVQSFIESDADNHYEDFSHFVKLYIQTSAKGQPLLLMQQGNLNIFALWVNSKIL